MSETSRDDRVTEICAGFMEQYAGLDPAEQERVRNRLAQFLGALVVPPLVGQEDYRTTLAAMELLEVPSDVMHMVPSYPELVQASRTTVMHEYLLPYTRSMGAGPKYGNPPELTFHVPITDGKMLDRWLLRLNRGPEGVMPQIAPAVEESLLSGMSRRELSASLVLHDTTSPTDRVTPMAIPWFTPEHIQETGWVYSDMKVEDARRALQKERAEADEVGIRLDSMSPSGYLILQAKREIQGLPPLDRATGTRFLAANGKVIVAEYYRGNVRLTENYSFGREGIRRVVHLMIKPIG